MKRDALNGVVWFRGVVAIALLTLSVQSGWAWSVPTHEFLSDKAAEESVLNSGALTHLGFQDLNTQIAGTDFNSKARTYSVRKWIQDGAKFEDADGILPGTGRFLNHFHNPLADMPSWPTAGLSDLKLGASSALWAQDVSANPDWSWPAVRESHYQALTQPEKAGRDASFARVFAGLGHVIHLIQDMSQPGHVRNDAHPLDDQFGSWLNPLFGGAIESWARDNPETISNFATNLSSADPLLPLTRVGTVGGLAVGPISEFWDTDQYQGDPTGFPYWQAGGLTLGLAEYTNGSYFSADTINSSELIHQFPRPPVNIGYYSVCRDDPPLGSLWGTARWYISRYPCPTDPAQRPDHFLAQSLLGTVLLTKPDTITPALRLDDRVMEDYARDLIPRAVGYSAELINYFFRGQLSIEPVDPTHLRVTNLSTEPMQSGTIELYSDSEQGERARLLDPYVLTGPISPGQSTPPIPIPPLADRSLGGYTAVFRGSLGAEENAVIGTSGFQWVEEWDQGLAGRHQWYQTTDDPGEMNALPPGTVVQTTVSDGVIRQENMRPAGTDRLRPGPGEWPSSQTNESYIGLTDFAPLTSPYRDIFPLRVTPKTELVVKVDVMSVNVPIAVPQCSGNSWGNGAYQHIAVIFDNGYSLEVTVPEQQRYLIDTHNPLFITLGEETRVNLYEALQARGVSLTEPLAIKVVTITQHFLPPCEPTTEDQRQLLHVDYLRFVEGP